MTTTKDANRRTRGRKFDNSKPRWDLLPIEAMDQVVDVLTYGANKYDDDNWRYVKNGRRRYYAAALRHLTAWWKGERLDPKSKRGSGLPHLAHSAACLLFLISLESEMPRKRRR